MESSVCVCVCAHEEKRENLKRFNFMTLSELYINLVEKIIRFEEHGKCGQFEGREKRAAQLLTLSFDAG